MSLGSISDNKEKQSCMYRSVLVFPDITFNLGIFYLPLSTRAPLRSCDFLSVTPLDCFKSPTNVNLNNGLCFLCTEIVSPQVSALPSVTLNH